MKSLLMRALGIALMLFVSTSAWAGSVTNIGGNVNFRIVGPPNQEKDVLIPNGATFSDGIPIDNPFPSSDTGPTFSYTRTDPAADQTLLQLTIAAPNGVSKDPPPNNPDGFLKSGARADLLITVNKPTRVDIAIPPGQLIFLAGNLEFIYRKDGEEKTAFLFTFPEQQVSNFPVNPNSMQFETYTDRISLTPGEHLFSYKLDTPFTDPDAAQPNDGPTVNANLTFTTIPTPTAALGAGLLLFGLNFRRRSSGVVSKR